MKFVSIKKQKTMASYCKTMCIGGGRIVGIVLTLLVLALTFLNTVSARYLDSPCKVMSIGSDATTKGARASAQFNRCVVLSAELATRLNTHG